MSLRDFVTMPLWSFQESFIKKNKISETFQTFCLVGQKLNLNLKYFQVHCQKFVARELFTQFRLTSNGINSK
jgi:hypothetical protein